MTDLRETIEVLFQSLLLGDVSVFGPPQNHEYEYAFQRAADLLGTRDEDVYSRRFELRLRLAMHLSPASALSYNSTNPTPRYRLIKDYLVGAFGRSPELAERLGRDIAALLTAWDERRKAVLQFQQLLLKRQDNRCLHCRVRFAGRPLTLVNRDDFKPYHLAEEELLRPEVDHIEAISALGTNDMKNLQALCRLCNAGKWDGLGIDLREEVHYSGKEVQDVDRFHRMRMFYFVVSRDRGACRSCADSQSELTIRKVRSSGTYARSNLVTICVDCAYASPGSK